MKTVTAVQENCEDIYADAKVINEKREAQEQEYEDASESAKEDTEEGGCE